MADDADILAVALPQICRDEGFRSHAYPDPLTGAEPFTVGYGATGGDIDANTVWTQAQAENDLIRRVSHILDQLDANYSWWRE